MPAGPNSPWRWKRNRRRCLWAVAAVWILLGMRPADLGWCSRPPSQLEYALFRGRSPGRLPGHAVVGFPEPLPHGYRIVGGSYQFYNTGNGQVRFTVSRWPGCYRLIWRCGAP